MNDWSSFTPERIEEALGRRGTFSGMGYLVWNKVAFECLAHPELPRVLAGEPVREDPLLSSLRSAKARVEETVSALVRRGITKVRLGISWCEWCEPYGPAWISWCLRTYAAYLQILPCVAFTPPALSENGNINTGPRDLRQFPRFIAMLIHQAGTAFTEIELGNEWNLDTDWHSAYDPEYERFMVMIAAGALVARHFGKRVVLGGPAGLDERTLGFFGRFAARGLFRHLDAAGFHDLRGTWSDATPRPHLTDQVTRLRATIASTPVESAELSEAALKVACGALPRLAPQLRRSAVRERTRPLSVWVTEYGFPACDPEERFDLARLEEIQLALFAYGAFLAYTGAFERLYWYTYQDYVGPSVRAHTTGWEDVLQHHYGDTREDGTPRLLGRVLNEGGVRGALLYAARHDLFPLVDAASLARKIPAEYRSNVFRS